MADVPAPVPPLSPHQPAPAVAHGLGPPSEWLLRWAHLLAPGRALDLACGHGRHSRWLAGLGASVTAVDRDATALASLADLAPRVRVVQADIEAGPWPLEGQRFDTVVVTNYLWRALWPRILDSLAPGGVLLYETFAIGHAKVGKPSNPDFLLQPGELLRVCSDLRVVAFEDGYAEPPPRHIQRIVAVRPRSVPLAELAHLDPADAPRYPLAAG